MLLPSVLSFLLKSVAGFQCAYSDPCFVKTNRHSEQDVPKGQLRQDAESDRGRSELEPKQEAERNTARSRWEGKRREEAFLPGAKTYS